MGTWSPAARAGWERRDWELRLADHQRELASWEAERAELARAVAELERDEPWSPDGLERPTSIRLKRGERIHHVVDDAGLVEPRRAGGPWRVGYTGFSVRRARALRWNVGGTRDTYVPERKEPKVIDTGTVTITDRRMVFQGASKAREWAFARLLGYQHESVAPVTLVQVSNRQNASGILYRPDDGALFQLRLASAIARANGTEVELLAALRGELAQHEFRRPLPPPPPSSSAVDRRLVRPRLLFGLRAHRL